MSEHRCSAVAKESLKRCRLGGTKELNGEWFCGLHDPERGPLRKPKKEKPSTLTDEHVKMLTGAATPLPKNVSAVAVRLRKLLDRYKIEYVTVQRGTSTVKFARYQESETTL